MSLKTRYLFAVGRFDEAMRGIYAPIAEAGTAAITAAAEDVKVGGRESIAAAGFSKRWQNTFRVDVYPKRRASANAAASIYHKIPYADVFESGAEIRGKPHLWVPVPGAPKKVNRKKMTPQAFAKGVGPLFPLPTRGRRPVLAAAMSLSKAAARRGPPYRLTMAGLRRGAAGQGITRAVPVFVGIDRVRIPKKFKITEVVEAAADRLPALYLANLKAD